MEGAAETAVLLMTDVEGSTRMWHDDPGEMNLAMTRHHRIVHGTIQDHGGWRPVDQGEGDSVFAAFGTARAAVRAAADIQRRLAEEPWRPGTELRVRIGIHTGEVFPRDGNLFGDTVNRCARMRTLGHGGQTLVSAAVFAQVRDHDLDGVTWRDLGEHRMKDLTRPERVYQMDVDGLPTEFPPLKSLDRARHNLPVQTTTLVGRDEDVSAVRQLVETHRLVTLVGFGGVGKTRLALEVAATLAVGDADGVWFVDLSNVTDPARVPTEIAAALSIREAGSGAVDAVIEELATKHLLLVLDNLEQVLGCVPFVARLLTGAPDVSILATSREALHVRGEHQYQVSTLAPAEATELFVSRAAAVRPGVGTTQASHAAITSICSRLDGHPLAIELTAARMKVLTAEALLSRLDSALAMSSAGGRDRPERQQTLRATIAWSYDALSHDERCLLDRMSVFPGSATLEAVEVVCAADPEGGRPLDVLGGLSALVEKSLVRALEQPGDDELRYDMLVSVREFAAEHLAASGHTAELARRHAGFYRRLNVLEAESREEGAAIVQRTSRELHNMRAAFAWSQREGTPDDELSFSTFLLVLIDAGHLAEAHGGALHALARQPQRVPGRVRMLGVLSYLYWHTSEEDEERRAIEEQLAEAREVGDPSLIASALIDSLQNVVDREELLARVEEIDALMASLPRSHTEVPMWYLNELRDNRLSIALRFADPDRALRYAREYYATTQFDQFVAGTMVAQLLVDRGDWDGAAQVLREIETFAGVTWNGDRLDDGEAPQGLLQPMWIRILAQVALGSGDAEAALAHAESAMRRFEPLEVPHWSARTLTTLAACHFELGRSDEARSALLAALALFEPGSAHAGSVQWRLARVARLRGDLREAHERVTEARALLQGHDLMALNEVLGLRIEEVHHAVEADPEHAARLLAHVERDRGPFVLGMRAGDDVEPLRCTLRQRLGADRVADILTEVAAERSSTR